MHGGAHAFLQALAIVLGVAAVTTVVFQRLRQPVVLGYLIAGLIVGPHLPIPLVADVGVVQTLSELGVILLMFSLGLEFSVGKLVRVGPTAGVTAVVQCSLMVVIGFGVGRALGWSTREALFGGAAIAISSTTIIAKAFEEQGVRGRLRDLVVGILIVEDLVGILMMALLTAVATPAGLSAGALLVTSGKLLGFLVGLLVAGILVVPRAIRYVHKLGRKETLLVASVGLCFSVALLAQHFGYSVALGAFIAGSLVSESGLGEEVDHLVAPVRDVMAAVFFVSVGMLLDPQLVARNWVAVLVFTLAVIVGKIVSVTLGAFLSGAGVRTATQAGLCLAQIGEFSFIIAALGIQLGATRDFIYPIAVAVSAITTLSTPWLIRASGPAAALIDRKLPHSLQTFAALYSSWIEQLRAARQSPTAAEKLRRRIRLLILDAAVLAAIIVAAALPHDVDVWLRAAVAGALSVPFAVGIFRLAGGIGVSLAELAFPPGSSGVDTAGAPRRALVVGLQQTVLLVVGLPLVAVTQPFIHGWILGPIFLVTLAVLGVILWRRAADLEGHVRAGAQIVVEALAAQARGPDQPPRENEAIRELLHGLGEPTPVKLSQSSSAVGRSLAQLDLRGETGATVLAIVRDGSPLLVPGAREPLKSGDVLALAGTRESIEAAKALLESAGQ